MMPRNLRFTFTPLQACFGRHSDKGNNSPRTTVKRSLHLTTAGACLLLLGASCATASTVELIVNGGFESGNFTSNGARSNKYDLISQAGPQDLIGWTVGYSMVRGFDATDTYTHSGSGLVEMTGIGDTVPYGSIRHAFVELTGVPVTGRNASGTEMAHVVMFYVSDPAAAFLDVIK